MKFREGVNPVQHTTATTPAIAALMDSESKTSICTSSAPDASNPSARIFLGSRDAARTVTPFARSCATTRRPVAPDAPTTSTGPDSTPASADAVAGETPKTLPSKATRTDASTPVESTSRRPGRRAASPSAAEAAHRTDAALRERVAGALRTRHDGHGGPATPLTPSTPSMTYAGASPVHASSSSFYRARYAHIIATVYYIPVIPFLFNFPFFFTFSDSIAAPPAPTP